MSSSTPEPRQHPARSIHDAMQKGCGTDRQTDRKKKKKKEKKAFLANHAAPS